MFAYPEDFELANRMSRLAREELRHFELVQQKLVELGVPFRRLSPSRYAEGLRRALRRDEPGRRVDLLLCGALIEARSHERFIGLIERLPAPLAEFYASLAAAEARHAGLYLRLAARGGVRRRGRGLRSLRRSRRSSRPRRTRSSGFTRGRLAEAWLAFGFHAPASAAAAGSGCGATREPGTP